MEAASPPEVVSVLSVSIDLGEGRLVRLLRLLRLLREEALLLLLEEPTE
jgi:hypothetical protein